MIVIQTTYMPVELSLADVMVFNNSLSFFGISLKENERYGKRKSASMKEKLSPSFPTLLAGEKDLNNSE